jgi:HK97 family phage major capsid protein
MNLNSQSTDLLQLARDRLEKALVLAAKPDASADEMAEVGRLTQEVKEFQDKAARLGDLHRMAQEIGAMQEKVAAPVPSSQWKSAGEFLQSVHAATFRGYMDQRLGKPWFEKGEPEAPHKAGTGAMWATETKDLVENVGASGGFLVPVEQQEQLLQVPGPELVVRPRATIVPIRRRQIQWPVLDQTNTTSGRPAWYGGVLAKWTEEAAQKDETEPVFRQIDLVAHKLVLYTEASDELLEDSAISLEALLGSLYQGAGSWYEEDAFVSGTGAGQPLGVINAGATFVQARAAAGAIGLVDIINMLEHFQGSNPIWMITRSALPSLMQLNGPAGNASYVFMPNARDGMPGYLFGYPVFWSEHCPLIGSRGDIILADWKMYLVADRKALTIDASKHYRFRYDLTSWRGVKRVDGQPWLSQPVYYSDGTTQVSPFVILDAGAGS